MTKDEEYKTVGKTTIDLKDARKHLACLEAQLSSSIESINTAMPFLRRQRKASVAEGKFFRIIKGENDFGPKYEWPELGKLSALINEINSTTDKIQKLQDQLDRM